MDQSPSPDWTQFFSQLNLSPEWVVHYSQSFSENSMHLEMIPDLQPDFMSYLGIHKLGHLIMIKNLADELLSRLSPLLSPSIPSYPSSNFESCHSNISSINTNYSLAFNTNSETAIISNPHDSEAILPRDSLDITTSIPIEQTVSSQSSTSDTELELSLHASHTVTTRKGLTSKVKVPNKRRKTRRQTLASVTNKIQSNHISISNSSNHPDVTPHAPSHSPDISSPGVFVFHTATTRPVISRSHPSATETQLRNESDKCTSPFKSGLILPVNKTDNSQFTPVRNQLTNIMSSSPNSLVQNPNNSIPMSHTSQDTDMPLTSPDNVDLTDRGPDEHSSPAPATHLNTIQQPTNSPCVTEMNPVHNISKSKRKPATTKRITSKRLKTKSHIDIMVRQFDPALFDGSLSPPLSPQKQDLTTSQHSDNTTNTLHVHDSEVDHATSGESPADSSLRTSRRIPVSLTELNSYEQYPISATAEGGLSEDRQEYLSKLAMALGELPNFFDQDKIKPSPEKKTGLRKKNNTKTQDKLSPTKSRTLHSKKTRIGVRANRLIRPTKKKTKLTQPKSKKNKLVRQMTELSFDTRGSFTSPENSESDFDRRIEHSLSIVKKKYHNFYTTIYPELRSQDNVIKLATKRKRDYVTPNQGVQVSLKDTLIHARQERRTFACHKCLLCFETPYQLLQHSMLQTCDEITSSYPEY